MVAIAENVESVLDSIPCSQAAEYEAARGGAVDASWYVIARDTRRISVAVAESFDEWLVRWGHETPRDARQFPAFAWPFYRRGFEGYLALVGVASEER